MKLTFHGAAGGVTGSQHKLESNGATILLDCGMFQGRRKEAEKKNREMPFPARAVDAVVLSHAHIDHSGRLPLLAREGFHGPIYATPATIDLCASMLRDTAHIAETDAGFVNRHHPGEEPVEPLYTIADADATMPLFRPVAYRTPTGIAGGLTMESYDAGHILGSSSILLTDGQTRLGFSGDVGRPGLPIIRDPDPLPPVDYLIMESTYGSRKHPRQGEALGRLEDVVKRTIGRGGRLIIPAFAVGRTQQIVLLLHQLINEQRIPAVPMFVDSPLAVDVTKTFRAHPECFDAETAKYLAEGEDPFGFNRLSYVREAEGSKKLNNLRGPFVVISPSGMCEAGRVLHHLAHNVGDPENTVLITGYQAENTLGRKLKNGMKLVRIYGVPTEVRAEIQCLDELSGHADAGELIQWMKSATGAPGEPPTLKRVFLVHGEPEESGPLAKLIESTYGIEATPVSPGQVFDLKTM
jgi:metallo-beta-lactamase family protein